MDINCVCVVIVCVSGLLFFNNAFGETEHPANMLNEIRVELNSLKLSNERNEHKIMILEKQVNECQRENVNLHRIIAPLEHIEERVEAIGNNVEPRHMDILKRRELIELQNIPSTITNVSPINGGQTTMEEQKENGDGVENIQNKEYFDYVDKQTADVDGVAEDNKPDNTDKKDERSLIDKRIVPVTSRPTINTRIAFSAYLNPHVISVSKGQTVPFNHVLTNLGQAFNIFSHIFTCPISGIYHFASSVMAEKHHKALTKIVKDHSVLAEMYSASESDALFDQGSNSVVTVCNKGERVWVISSDGGDVAGDMFTTFAGFLVAEL